MFWLAAAISAYLLFALGNLGDKFVLSGPPKPQSYTFWVAAGGLLSVFLIPFIGFSMPGWRELAVIMLAGSCYLFGLYFLYSALEDGEVSKIMPALGGFLAIFTLIFSSILFRTGDFFSLKNIAAFILLFGGSLAAVWEKGKPPAKKNLKIVALAAFFFAANYNFSKIVFAAQPFLQGFIWMRLATFLAALIVFARIALPEAFSSKPAFNKKNAGFFVLAQTAGGGGFLLENLAISLVSAALLPFVVVLQGVQYVFLFFLSYFLSLKISFFKENFSRTAVLQRLLALALIVSGLLVLAFAG